jgi:hypothetical protein
MSRVLLLLVVTLPAAPVVAQQSTADSSGMVSVLTGVYSTAQARRGESTHRKHCTECHNAVAYTGAAFRRLWAGRPVYEFWDQVRTTMPNDSPGSLKPGEYLDILAYVLRLNGYPAGEHALPSDPEQLRTIRFDPLPPTGKP